MSRVGKKEITIPEKTSVDYKDRVVVVKGEKGTLTRTIHPAVDLDIKDNTISVIIEQEDRKTQHPWRQVDKRCSSASDDPYGVETRKCQNVDKKSPLEPEGIGEGQNEVEGENGQVKQVAGSNAN